MEVEDIVKRWILFVLCALCLALPEGALANEEVTVLFTGDLVGQLTPRRG